MWMAGRENVNHNNSNNNNNTKQTWIQKSVVVRIELVIEKLDCEARFESFSVGALESSLSLASLMMISYNKQY